jgi:hypothetical protein
MEEQLAKSKAAEVPSQDKQKRTIENIINSKVDQVCAQRTAKTIEYATLVEQIKDMANYEECGPRMKIIGEEMIDVEAINTKVEESMNGLFDNLEKPKVF